MRSLLASTASSGALGAIATIAGTAPFVTKAVDLIRNALDVDVRAPKWVWNVAAFVIGIAAALAVKLDVLQSLAPTASAIVARVATGLSIGGGAAGYHELFDFLSSAAKRTPDTYEPIEIPEVPEVAVPDAAQASAP